MDSLVGLPDDPASLYIAVDSSSLVVYIEPALTVNVIGLSQLNVALCQENESALALKFLLEKGPAIKVFFDARMPARILFNSCSIKLATEVRYIFIVLGTANNCDRLALGERISTKCK